MHTALALSEVQEQHTEQAPSAEVPWADMHTVFAAGMSQRPLLAPPHPLIPANLVSDHVLIRLAAAHLQHQL